MRKKLGMRRKTEDQNGLKLGMSSYEEKNGHEMENMRRKMGSNWG
jgi:hypothetical protein